MNTGKPGEAFEYLSMVQIIVKRTVRVEKFWTGCNVKWEEISPCPYCSQRITKQDVERQISSENETTFGQLDLSELSVRARAFVRAMLNHLEGCNGRTS